MQQLPDPTYVERILSAINRYPAAMFMATVFAAIVVAGIYCWRK